MPREKFLAALPPVSARPTTSRIRRVAVWSRTPATMRWTSRFSTAVMCGKIAGVSIDWPVRRLPSCSAAVPVRPNSSMSPRVWNTRPVMTRMKVVLPAPLRPIRP